MSRDSFPSPSDPSELTRAQHALLRKAIEGGRGDGSGLASQREALRELCDDFRDSPEGPEKFLVAFKASLIEAANDARIPHGAERSELLSRIVTVFIDELYGLRARAELPSDAQRRTSQQL